MGTGLHTVLLLIDVNDKKFLITSLICHKEFEVS